MFGTPVPKSEGDCRLDKIDSRKYRNDLQESGNKYPWDLFQINNDPDSECHAFNGVLKKIDDLACPNAHLHTSNLEINSTIINDNSKYIALVKRGGCTFYQKVLYLQSQGYKAIIIANNEISPSLITMYSPLSSLIPNEIHIPSIFISQTSYNILILNEIKEINLIPDLNDENGNDEYYDSVIWNTFIFLLILPLVGLGLIYLIVIWHQQYENYKMRAPIKFVNNLPIIIYSKEQVNGSIFNHGSISNGTINHCIICLDNYINGTSELIKLPCNHFYHAKCIKKWLIQEKKTCPLCKRDVTAFDSKKSRCNNILGVRRNDINNEDFNGSGSIINDTTPLLLRDEDLENGVAINVIHEQHDLWYNRMWRFLFNSTSSTSSTS